MFKICRKYCINFLNMSDQDVDDIIIGQDITYIPPMHAENIPSKKEYIKH